MYLQSEPNSIPLYLPLSILQARLGNVFPPQREQCRGIHEKHEEYHATGADYDLRESIYYYIESIEKIVKIKKMLLKKNYNLNNKYIKILSKGVIRFVTFL